MTAWDLLGANVTELDDISRQFVETHTTVTQIRQSLTNLNGQDWVRGRYGADFQSYVDTLTQGSLSNAVATLESFDHKLLTYVSAQRELSGDLRFATPIDDCPPAEATPQVIPAQAVQQDPVRLQDVQVDNFRGGTRSIFEQFVTPTMRGEGLAPGSQLRDNDTVPGERSSDHWVRTNNSYAIDYPTTDGETAARRLAQDMGITDWQPDRTQNHYIDVDGQRYRVQILWGAEIDHDDHVHVGIRRVD